MICTSCAAASDAGNSYHGAQVCECPQSCSCQHGFNLEMDPDAGKGPEFFGGYLDALPEDDPRRVAYEARVGRKIER